MNVLVQTMWLLSVLDSLRPAQNYFIRQTDSMTVHHVYK